LGKNSANWGVTFLATITYGAVIVPILPDFKANDVQHITNHSESVMLFVADNIFESLEMEKMKMLKAAFLFPTSLCLIQKRTRKGIPSMSLLNKSFNKNIRTDFRLKISDLPQCPIANWQKSATLPVPQALQKV